jgi:hydroxymethylglutaryl-CoA synthase
MDFWRPNYLSEAIVDGQYSCELYLRILDQCWRDYNAISKRNFNDHEYFCYHTPVPKLVESAHKRLAKICGYKNLNSDIMDKINKQVETSLIYSHDVGNCYTASLYLCVSSLLENNLTDDLSNKRIGMYSYGSGCSGEYFSAIIQQGYQSHLFTDAHREMLINSKSLSYDEYIDFYNAKLPVNGSTYSTPKYSAGKFRLIGVSNHKRIYNICSQ